MNKARVLSRFEAKVQKGDGCWFWAGLIDRYGYGQFFTNGQYRGAHRVAYGFYVGTIPAGLTLDHLCRNRLCVRPDHLEPVPLRENVLRGVGPTALNAAKTHCNQGHPFDLLNTYVGRGKRECRACNREAVRRYEIRNPS